MLGLIVLSINCWAFDLKVANIYHIQNAEGAEELKNISGKLIKEMNVSDIQGALGIGKTKSDSMPKSILEVRTLCSDEDIDFLLYGYIKSDEYSHDMELKLYDHSSGKTQRVFYSKNNVDNYNDLILTMADRVIDYLYNDLGLVQEKVLNNEGFITHEYGLGYWFPLNSYSESTLSLVMVHAGFSFYPKEQLFDFYNMGVTSGFGLTLDYSIGMNKKEYESFVLHGFKIGIPGYLRVLHSQRNIFIFNITPGINIETVAQDRLYGSLHTETTSAFLLSTGLSYEYLVGDKDYSFGIGVNNSYSFYEELSIALSSHIFIKFY